MKNKIQKKTSEILKISSTFSRFIYDGNFFPRQALRVIDCFTKHNFPAVVRNTQNRKIQLLPDRLNIVYKLKSFHRKREIIGR